MDALGLFQQLGAIPIAPDPKVEFLRSCSSGSAGHRAND